MILMKEVTFNGTSFTPSAIKMRIIMRILLSP